VPDKDTDLRHPCQCFLTIPLEETINQERYLNALAGPKGEQISLVESCCPFPSKEGNGSWVSDVYEVKWEGLKTPAIYI
jgi:hypothetical protein